MPKESKDSTEAQAPVCPSCKNPSLVTDYKHGEVICKKCGLVIEDSLFDFGPEWRAFDEEQKSKRARIGGPVKFAKLSKGLTTEIDRYDRDIRGGAIQPERKAQLYRLRKWQRRSRMSDSVQRNLSIALPELDRMCAYLNIPNNIKEECAMWYRKAVNKGIVRGRSIESVVAAIIYLISRKHHLPKTLEELEAASGVRRKDIGRSYRFACRRLGLRMPIATPMDYVPRFAAELGLSGETEAKAVEILQKAREKGVTSGRGPTGVAAAAIYLAGRITKDKQTQKGIAGRLAGVTEVTIRNRYEELERVIGTSLPKFERYLEREDVPKTEIAGGGIELFAKPRKRGRPPKPKKPEKPKKKRGRPPKPKPKERLKPRRKRGRPVKPKVKKKKPKPKKRGRPKKKKR